MRQGRSAVFGKLVRFFTVQAVLAVVFSAVLLALTYSFLARHVFEGIRADVIEIAVHASQAVDVGAHESLHTQAQYGSPQYEQVVEKLWDIVAANPSVKSVYTLRPTDDPETFTFVVDSAVQSDENENGVIDAHEANAQIGEEYDVTFTPELANGLLGPTADKEVTHDRWGAWVSGYAPVKDAEGRVVAVIGVDVSAARYWAELSALRYQLGVVFFFSAFLSALVAFAAVSFFKRENKVIADALEQLDTIVALSPVGIMALDGKGIVHEINPAMQSMLGLERNDVNGGRPLSALMRSAYAKKLQLFLQELRRKTSIEKEIAFVDKETRYMRVLGRTYAEQTTGAAQVLLLMQDVTAQRRMLTTYQERSDAAETRMQESHVLRDKFIQVVSHQLRTPLNSARWNLELLLSGKTGRIRPVQKEILSLTYGAEIEAITRLGDLLTALDIDEGRIHLELQLISLADLVRVVVDRVRNQAKERRIRIVVSLPKNPVPDTMLDPDLIRQCIQHLLDNAIIFSAEGATVRVKVSSPSSGIVKFEVKDAGVGIPKDEQRYIFNSFFRASNASAIRTDASGLGLFIVKHFIERHGGTVGFVSVEGKGSTFWIALPVVKEVKKKDEHV